MSHSQNPPSTATTEIPISVGLLSRRSITGAVVVLGIVLFYMIIIPMVNNSVKGEGSFTAGEPYAVSDTLQITPQDGWSLDTEPGAVLTSISKSGATFVIVPPVETTQTAEEVIQLAIDGLKGDASTTWVIGDPQTFVTDAGDHGLSVTGHSPQNAIETYVIVTDELAATFVGNSPDGVWTSVSDEMNAMVLSAQFTTPGGES